MKKIYACLLGNWVCLNDDPDCVVSQRLLSPDIWWEESAPMYSPSKKDPKYEHSCYGQDYVQIQYLGKGYRIHPMFIQIVTEGS